MELFINHVPSEKFTKTNQIWNKLRLNAPWSVGYVSYLINVKAFTQKQQWKSFYYQTGQERNKLLQTLAKEQSTIQVMDNELLSYKYPKRLANIPNKFKNLNFYYGRTQKQLEKKGYLLYKTAKKNKLVLTLEECIACVKFRVIGETWNGIVGRERNVQNYLKKIFKYVDFRKTTAEFDHRYAVDVALFKNNRLICGLQIKPVSYLGRAPYLQTARKANQKKNAIYQKKFGVPVFDLIAKTNGTITNKEIIYQIEQLLK